MRQRNLTKIVVCLMISLGVTLYLAPPVLPSIPTVSGASRTIYLVANYIAWNYTKPSGSNPPITVTQGDLITIQLSVEDGISHRFVLDLDGDGGAADMGTCSAQDLCSGSFMTSTSVSFTASTTGSYTYYCTVHYNSMLGTFTVQTAPSAPDFAVSSNPSSLSIVQGSNANSTITISSVNNFAKPISLSAASSPSGPTFIFNSTTVTPPAGGTAHSKLTISTLSGTHLNSYTITVTASNSTTYSKTTTISVSVISPSSDFTIVSNPTSLTVAQSSQGTTTITLTSINSFSGTVNLATSVNPSGPTASLDSSSVTLSRGGTATATLTIGTGSSGYYSSPVSLGSYTVTVTGTSGSLSHPAAIALTVGNTSAPASGVGNLPISLIVGVIVGVIAVLGVGVYLVRRKPGK